tara:strand:- start:108212 stop:108805 length:594 start_codon:yes stop_codon:yes gene_type:complete
MKNVLIILLISLLTSCATLPAPEQASNQAINWQQRQQQLQLLTAWNIRGAVAIRQGKQAQSASIYLQQHQRQFELQVFGPLGVGRNTLTGKPGKVKLVNGSGESFTAKSPEALMKQQMGWSLPISNLYYWLRGLPAPGLNKQIQFDKYHHVVKIQQQGWNIVYEKYTGVQHIDLPSKISMTFGDLSVNIIVSQWQLS